MNLENLKQSIIFWGNSRRIRIWNVYISKENKSKQVFFSACSWRCWRERGFEIRTTKGEQSPKKNLHLLDTIYRLFLLATNKFYLRCCKFYDFTLFRIYLETKNTSFFKAAYLAFLMLFSYYMLCEYSFYDTKNWSESLEIDQSHYNLSGISKEERPVKNPIFMTYLLIFWVFSLIMEEVRQVSEFLRWLTKMRSQWIDYFY